MLNKFNYLINNFKFKNKLIDKLKVLIQNSNNDCAIDFFFKIDKIKVIKILSVFF